jgi:uncharacterized protein (TIGR00255 family)
MTISSMTGFGRAAGTAGAWTYLWELRSVNGKGLDVRVRLPAGMDLLEQQVRTLAAHMLKRGNVQVSLQLSCEEPSVELRINPNALFAAVEAAQQVSDAMGEPVSADAVLAMRGVVEAVSVEADPEAIEARDAELLKAAESALEALAANRREEGLRLASVVSGQLDRIEALTAEAAANPSRTPGAIQARLAQQVERLTGASPALDPDRLHQEAMLLAVKADIQEEIDRLRSHVEAARELLATEGDPIGRKFDFLAQEFNREANTLCSKSSDTALTRTGLELKNTIDQLREQVQNIE